MKKQIRVPGSTDLLRRAFRFLLLLAVCAIPFAQAQGSAVLYDQLNNLGAHSTDSDDFWDLPAWTTFTADDFVVPAGQTWRVTQVDAQGVYLGKTGQANYFNVAFYQDRGGLPGQPVYTGITQSYYNNAG